MQNFPGLGDNQTELGGETGGTMGASSFHTYQRPCCQIHQTLIRTIDKDLHETFAYEQFALYKHVIPCSYNNVKELAKDSEGIIPKMLQDTWSSSDFTQVPIAVTQLTNGDTVISGTYATQSNVDARFQMFTQGQSSQAGPLAQRFSSQQEIIKSQSTVPCFIYSNINGHEKTKWCLDSKSTTNSLRLILCVDRPQTEAGTFLGVKYDLLCTLTQQEMDQVEALLDQLLETRNMRPDPEYDPQNNGRRGSNQNSSQSNGRSWKQQTKEKLIDMTAARGGCWK